MKVNKYFKYVFLLLFVLMLQFIYLDYNYSARTDNILETQSELLSQIDQLNNRLAEMENHVDFVTSRSFVNTHKIPETIYFCEQKMDIKNPYIREKVEREFYALMGNQGQIQLYLKRLKRYESIIMGNISQDGLPADLKYLAVHESALLPTIRSNASAVGLWQFMPESARLYGLKVNSYIDERCDPEKSTRAALRYLSDLKSKFENWPLALAAYNAGPNRISRAMGKQKTSDFFSLELPEETERYFFKILASKIILSNAAKYGFVMNENDYYKPHATIKQEIKIYSQPMTLEELAKLCDIPLYEFKDLNPVFRAGVLPVGIYEINVPKEKQNYFVKAYQNYERKFFSLAKNNDTNSTISGLD